MYTGLSRLSQQIVDEIDEREWRKLLACTTEGASQTELGDEQADDARVGAAGNRRENGNDT